MKNLIKGTILAALLFLPCFGEMKFRLTPDAQSYINEAKQTEVKTILNVGDKFVQVIGPVSDTNLKNIKISLEDMPSTLLKYTNTIYITHDIAFDNVTEDSVVGLSCVKDIVLDSKRLDKGLDFTKDVLYHEVGHVFDHSNGNLSKGSLWGKESITKYGATSKEEDFAETFSFTLMNWNRFTLPVLSKEKIITFKVNILISFITMDK